MSISDYIHKRMLKHAGLLSESATAENYKKEWETAFNQYSDLYKDLNQVRPRGVSMQNMSVEDLNAEIEDMRERISAKIAAKEAGLPDPEEEYNRQGGYGQYESKGTKLSRGSLQQIIKEEVSRVLSEMEIVNADSGEILTVDKLPPKYAGRLTKADGYDALYDPDFEALRKDLTLDPDTALDMLEEEAAEMYGDVQGDLGTAIDMAMGLKMSFPKEWAAALTTRRIKDMYYDDMGPDGGPEYDSLDDALARFLAERMG
jgi:hypothetical protein